MSSGCAIIMSMRSMSILLFLCVVFLNSLQVKACYFTDCPNSYLWNGKRQPDGQKLTRSDRSAVIRKCPPCGLRGTGQCFSSRMCCTPALGCIVGENEITEPCRRESRIPLECASAGPACLRPAKDNRNVEVPGVCAADGLCCNTDGCTYHQQCLLSEKSPQSFSLTSSNVFQSILGDIMKTIRAKERSINLGFPDRSVIRALQQYRRSRSSEPDGEDDDFNLMKNEMY